jgi:hypothetical protein
MDFLLLGKKKNPTMSSATEEKDLGTIAWKEGEYQRAIDHFTKALSLCVNEPDLQLVLYSNRSAAYLKLKKYTEAVSDGDNCIAVDASWIKGYTRKGDALYAAGKLNEASSVYSAGLKKDPNDKTLLEKSVQLNASLNKASKARISGYFQSAIRVTRYFMLINVLLFLVSLIVPIWNGFNRGCYIRAALSQVLLCLLALCHTHGFPKFKTEYLQALVLDPSTIKLFLATILMFSKPYILAVGSPFLSEFSFLLPSFVSYLQQHLPLMEGQLRPYLLRFAPQFANQDLAALMSPTIVNQISFQLVRMAASAEVMQGLYLLLELITPSRNPMFVMIWWQFLQMRYMTDSSGHTKYAFGILDQRITSILTHKFCPQILNTGYTLLKQYLIKRVTTVRK